MQDDDARRVLTKIVNDFAESGDPDRERIRLGAVFSDVMDTEEVRAQFEVIGFAAPFVRVVRKSDRATGTLVFQHHPRFYFDFHADEGE